MLCFDQTRKWLRIISPCIHIRCSPNKKIIIKDTGKYGAGAFAGEDIKKGEVMLPLRVMLVGGKFGPGVFAIAEQIGQAETIARISSALALL